MPQYEYFCEACQKSFSVFLTLSQYDKETVRCPQCGSDKVQQQVSAFFAVTSKKS